MQTNQKLNKWKAISKEIFQLKSDDFYEKYWKHRIQFIYYLAKHIDKIFDRKYTTHKKHLFFALNARLHPPPSKYPEGSFNFDFFPRGYFSKFEEQKIMALAIDEALSLENHQSILSNFNKLSKEPICKNNIREFRSNSGYMHEIINPFKSNLFFEDIKCHSAALIPSIFQVENGKCIIKSVINGVDKIKFYSFYDGLAEIFEKMVPFFREAFEGFYSIPEKGVWNARVIVKAQDYIVKRGEEMKR